MRARHRISAVLTAALLTVALPGPVTAKSGAPTRAQIRSALAHARRSSYLWATVNVCDTARHPNQIGIRGQMPTLGFATHLAMRVTFSYWSATDRRFEPITGLSPRVDLGLGSRGSRQGGVLFSFTGPVLLSGEIRYEWSRAGKILGSATRSTGRGYKHVDEGDPPGHSAASCRIT